MGIGSMSTYWFNVKTLIVDDNMSILDFIKPFELFVTYLLYDHYHYVVNINFYIRKKNIKQQTKS